MLRRPDGSDELVSETPVGGFGLQQEESSTLGGMLGLVAAAYQSGLEARPDATKVDLTEPQVQRETTTALQPGKQSGEVARYLMRRRVRVQPRWKKK